MTSHVRRERTLICTGVREKPPGDNRATGESGLHRRRTLSRSRDTLHPADPPYNRGSECTAFEIGSARYSSTRDPGYGIARRWGEKGRGEAHRLSYNLCSHLKETLPGGTGSRIARTPRVWSYITSRPYLESFVTDSIGVAFGAPSSWEGGCSHP